MDGRAAQNLTDPEKADCFFAVSHRHRRLGQTEWTGFGAWFGAGVPDNFRMRLQTNGQRRWPLREQSAEPIFVCFLVVLELPVFQRSQRERQASSFRKHAFVITKQVRAQQCVDQFLVRMIGGTRQRGVGHNLDIIYYLARRRSCNRIWWSF
jgi:hypothetical protein